MADVDEYGRAPDYADPRKPGDPHLREKLFGKVLVFRPWPAVQPAFVNDQPES